MFRVSSNIFSPPCTLYRTIPCEWFQALRLAGLSKSNPLFTHKFPLRPATEASEQVINEPNARLGVVLK